MFECKRCGATDKPVPFSGFEILQELSQKGREWHEHATKRPMDWRIQIPNTQIVIEAKGGSGDVSSRIHKNCALKIVSLWLTRRARREMERARPSEREIVNIRFKL
jgi:hypothetical protein